MQKQNGQEFFELEVRNQGVRSWVTYLLKLRSKSSKELLQLMFKDCWSTSEPYGRCEDGLLALKLPGSFQPSPLAYAWNETRIRAWRCYRSKVMVCIIHMEYVDDVWIKKTQLARAKLQFWMIRQFWQVWKHKMKFCFLAFLMLILSYKPVLYDVYDMLDTKSFIVFHKFWKMQEFLNWTMLLEF